MHEITVWIGLCCFVVLEELFGVHCLYALFGRLWDVGERELVEFLFVVFEAMFGEGLELRGVENDGIEGLEIVRENRTNIPYLIILFISDHLFHDLLSLLPVTFFPPKFCSKDISFTFLLLSFLL
jgi:hypothetical protein